MACSRMVPPGARTSERSGERQRGYGDFGGGPPLAMKVEVCWATRSSITCAVPNVGARRRAALALRPRAWRCCPAAQLARSLPNPRGAEHAGQRSSGTRSSRQFCALPRRRTAPLTDSRNGSRNGYRLRVASLELARVEGSVGESSRGAQRSFGPDGARARQPERARRVAAVPR